MFLYKYCNENGILILKNLSIKFLDVTKSNDPFDCMPVVNASPASRLAMRLKLARDRRNSKIPNLVDIEAHKRGFDNKWIKKQRKKAHAVATAGTAFNDFFKIKPDNFFMLSLSKNNSNPLMWSHYSNEHKGILIEFNVDNLFKKSSGNILWNLELNEVLYSKSRPILTPPISNSPSIYLTKDEFWCYEKEWRVFAMPINLNFDSDNNLYTFPLKPEMINSVVIGCRAENSFVEDIKSVLRNPYFAHVSLYYSKIDNIKFAFEYKKYS